MMLITKLRNHHESEHDSPTLCFYAFQETATAVCMGTGPVNGDAATADRK
jgi:hypothetical protein